MADKSFRWVWKALLAACLLAWAAIALTVATGTSSRTVISGGARGPTFGVLQFNLCDSGIAPCYTGRSVAAAAAIIRNERPDVVTLNEVCRRDLAELKQTMSEIHHGVVVASAFAAAGDRPAHGAYHCLNGEPYGIGVIAALESSNSDYDTFNGRYPVQDVADPEERVWVCIHSTGEFYACTTHTASTSAKIALAQCRFLTQGALPAVLRRRGDDPIVLGADLNLPPSGATSAQSCIGDRYQRADDGSRQDIVWSPQLTVTGREILDMHGTTDHPGLLVELMRPHVSRPDRWSA